MEKEINYEVLINDMYKIYLYCIDANNVKIFQPVNSKYTTTDKLMIASYIFIQLVQNKNGDLEEAGKIIGNALIRNLVNASTGNFEVNITDEKQMEIYTKVKTKVSTEKLDYLNRTLEQLKINIEKIEKLELLSVFEFSEELAEIFILLQLYLTGNEFAYDYIIQKVNQFKVRKNYDKEILVLLDDVIKSVDDKRKVIEILRKNDIYNLVSVVLNLRDINRYTQVNLIVPENVLFHTYVNTVMLFIFSDYLKEIEEKVNKSEIIIKTLFHDFDEYSGNEIIASMKVYSNETKKLFEEIEKADQLNLRDLIGENNFEIVSSYKKDSSGYISDILDKMLGIMKTLIELKYYNNQSLLKVFYSNECKRFEKFYNYERVETSKNKYFYTNLLKLHYIHIIEEFLKNENIMRTYFNSNEIEGIKESIEVEKRRLTL